MSKYIDGLDGQGVALILERELAEATKGVTLLERLAEHLASVAEMSARSGRKQEPKLPASGRTQAELERMWRAQLEAKGLSVTGGYQHKALMLRGWR